MNSFTSSFRSDLKALLVVCAILCVCELGLRQYGSYISKDLQQFDDFPRIARQLNSQPSPRMLFLGNSLTGRGVDVTSVLAAVAADGGLKISGEKIAPDNTAIVDWHYILKTFFVRTQYVPDIVVVGFTGGHLGDSRQVKARRLARHFAIPADMPELFATEFTSMNQQTDYCIGLFSATFTESERIKKRILNQLVPSFEDQTQELNQIIRRQKAEERAAPLAPVGSHRLRRFLDMLAEVDVQTVFVAMPEPTLWALEADVVATIEACGATMIDCRSVPGLLEVNFPDGYHLDEQGASLYSQFLGSQLAPLLAKGVAGASGQPHRLAEGL